MSAEDVVAPVGSVYALVNPALRVRKERNGEPSKLLVRIDLVRRRDVMPRGGGYSKILCTGVELADGLLTVGRDFRDYWRGRLPREGVLTCRVAGFDGRVDIGASWDMVKDPTFPFASYLAEKACQELGLSLWYLHEAVAGQVYDRQLRGEPKPLGVRL